MPRVIVVGAGAAGLAAARRLADAGCDVLVLEARGAIGGRACTLQPGSGHPATDSPVELGAEFIHGEGAPTHALVQQLGLSTVPITRMGNLWWAPDEGARALPLAQLPANVRRSILDLLADEQQLASHDLQGADMALSGYLTGVRHRDAREVAVADVLLAQTRCANVHSLSCDDIQHELQVDTAGSKECRIAEGYSMLLQRYSNGLQVQLSTPVACISSGRQSPQWRGPGAASAVCVFTADGTQHAADAVVVTAGVAALQSATDGIRFEPPLSDAKAGALASLRMSPATKLLFWFSRQLWPDELTFMCHTGVLARWWTPGHGRQPQSSSGAVIIAYVTAERAAHVDALPEQDALQLGLTELCSLLQLAATEVTACLLHARRVSWAAEPYIGGGYAHVPPGVGGHRVRRELARPEGRVFFAGEATAHTNPQTVHGALESGWRAADEVLQVLGLTQACRHVTAMLSVDATLASNAASCCYALALRHRCMSSAQQPASAMGCCASLC